MANLYRLSALVVLMFLGLTANSQQNKLVWTIQQIDSFCAIIDSNKTFTVGMSEGSLEIRGNKGGYSTLEYSDKNFGGVLHKLEYHSMIVKIVKLDSVAINTWHSYYYFNKELMKAIVKREEWDDRDDILKIKPICSTTLYFNKVTLLNKKQIPKKCETAESVLESGLKFQKYFYEREAEMQRILSH